VKAGASCSVVVNFAPKYPGTRPGSVLITDGSGTVKAKTLIYGGANGPQIGFVPGIAIQLPYPETVYGPRSLAVDGAGDVFVANPETSLVKLPAGGGAPIPIDTGAAPNPQSVAIDGAGDLFVYDPLRYTLVEAPAGGGPTTLLPYHAGYLGEYPVTGLGVDLGGNVFMELSDDYKTLFSALLKFPADGSDPVILPTFGLELTGLAIGWGGELFVLNGFNPSTQPVAELPPNGGNPIGLPFTFSASQSPQYLTVDGNGDLLAGNQELAAGGNTPTILPALPDTYGNSVQAVDSSGNFYYVGGAEDLDIYELQRSQLPALNFGSVTVGSTKTLPLVFTNTGNRTLVVSPSFESPSYKILSQSPEECLAGIAATHTCQLDIEFTALSEGDHTITLTLGSNGAADANLLLQGIGTK